MDKLIPKMYGNYGKYVNTFRSFPLIHDGLKPVERRVLLSVYDIARTSFTKSARVDGHCITGNNIIKLADGTTQPIEKLYLDKVEDFYLFGFDLINNKPAICKADCVKLVKYVNKTIKITTESGCVECALDHKWLTKLGEYKKAEDFIVGDTLESMKFGITDMSGVFENIWLGIGEYEAISVNGECYLSHYLADEYNEIHNIKPNIKLDENFHRHHINFNKFDNRPDNIERLSICDHSKIHVTDWINKGGSEILRKNGFNIHKKHPEIVQNLVNYTKTRSKEDPNWLSNNSKKFWSNMSTDEKNKFCKNISDKMKKYYEDNGTENISKKISEYWSNEDDPSVMSHRDINKEFGKKFAYKLKSNHSIKILKTIKVLLNKGLELNEENFNSNRTYSSSPMYDKILKYFNSYEEAIEMSIKYNNHTILKIEIINYDNEIPLYDIINSKPHNNFAVIFPDNNSLISSNCIGHYHPHGTSYGTLAGFARQGFLDPQGNFGNNIGVEESPPAAMRYTECRLSKWAHDLCFSLINFVPRVESELDPEPAYLPVMFPICLLGTEYTTGIGFGFRTFIPLYDIKDLNKRLLWLIEERKTEPIIKPVSDSLITATDAELKQLLTTGKGAITTQGVINIEKIACKAIVKSWPYGKRFQSILAQFQKELDIGDIGFADLSNEENGNYIQFEVLKQRNRDRIFKSLVTKLGSVLKGKLSFEMNMADGEGQVQLWSVDALLLQCFNNYKKTLNVMLNTSISEVMNKIEENITLQKIKPFIRKHMSRHITDVDVVYKAISDESNVDLVRVKDLIQKYKISKLLTMDTDISGLEAKESDFRNKLKNIDSYTLTLYQTFMKGLA